MRVAHLETGMHLYGGARQVLYLMTGLRARGVDNLLLCPVDSAIGRANDPRTARALPMPMGGDADIGLVWRLKGVLQAEGVDLLHVHSRRGADLYGGWAAHLAQTPAVLSRRVDHPEPPLLARAKYGRYRAVIGISRAIADVLQRQNVPMDRLHCVPSAVDTERFKPGDAARLRQVFALPDGVPLVGIVSQLIPRKGHVHLLEALASLQNSRPQLLCFGQGPTRDELGQKVTALGLESRVHFAGFRDDLEALLPGLDLMVHPALTEGLGVAVLEAQAAAVPVVASRAGGIPEAVQHNKTGLLVPPGDAKALAAAMESLLNDAALREAMGAEARRRVLEQFSIDAMVAGNLAVYEKVLARK